MINILTVIPIFESEKQYKAINGINKLLELFDQYKIDDTIDLNRKRVI